MLISRRSAQNSGRALKTDRQIWHVLRKDQTVLPAPQVNPQMERATPVCPLYKL